MIDEIDPLQDPRWPAFLDRHPSASVFHSRAWLEALRRTYDYQPLVLTTSGSGEDLDNGLVVCRIRSWLTGRRIVSLPFSDHCEPLIDDIEQLSRLVSALREECKAQGWKYLEIRPGESDLGAFPELVKSQSYCWHQVDLRPSLEELYRRFHHDCVRRKIRRAEREGLTYLEGQSESLLRGFYHLMKLTRRRHRLPPPPVAWFRNLIACMGDRLKIRMASQAGRPVASILTLSSKSKLVYKYGCSDRRFSNLGGTQLLFWKAIQEAKQNNMQVLDMGRSDWEDTGLINFKDHWGAARRELTYWRSGTGARGASSLGTENQMVRRIFGKLPYSVIAKAGTLLYRHAG